MRCRPLPRLILSLALLALAAVGCSPAGAQQLFETKATQAYMIDAETGSVLFSKDADALIQPASLAKLMTMEMAFDALKSGRLKLDDTFVVSEHAWRTQRPANEKLVGSILEHLLPQQAVQRADEPEDIAGVVDFLASPESSIITGQTINVDGGVARH